MELQKQCLRCKHSWFARTLERPKTCPNCKNRKWDQVKKPKKTKQEIREEMERLKQLKEARMLRPKTIIPVEPFI